MRPLLRMTLFVLAAGLAASSATAQELTGTLKKIKDAGTITLTTPSSRR